MNLRLVSQIVISLCQFTVLKYWLRSFASDRLRTKEAGIAELVERLIEKPGAILARVRVPGAARDFFPESTSGADSLPVSVQPPCEIACIKIIMYQNVFESLTGKKSGDWWTISRNTTRQKEQDYLSYLLSCFFA